MTIAQFRQIALGFAGAIESAHMQHPDFRAAGKIFATLGYPDEKWGMVKLTPEQQRHFVQTTPAVFQPSTGAWGKQGATQVKLVAASSATVQPTNRAVAVVAAIALWRQ
jgi:hypothetical protein